MDWSARGTRRNDEWPRADGESVIDYVTATGRFDLLKYQFNLATSHNQHPPLNSDPALH